MSAGMFCYDLKSRSFEIVGKNLVRSSLTMKVTCVLTSIRRRGIMRCTMFLAYTFMIPGSINGSLQQYKASPVPTDGKTLPGPVISYDYDYPVDDKAYLLQIGTHQGSPKLALVWRSLHSYQASDFNECQLHCCKFILHIRQDHDTSHPNFMAEILSTGIYRLGEDTAGVINCRAGVMMANEGANTTETSLGEEKHLPLAWKKDTTVEENNRIKKRKRPAGSSLIRT